VNLVQRLDGGREINCFVMRKGKPVLEDETRIDGSQGQKQLAYVVIQGKPGTANSGKVWLIDGDLFSLEFNYPTEHATSSEVEDIQVEICNS